MSVGIYFVAIVPPELIRQEVDQFKYYARDHFDSSRALRSPAHVTLEPPFKWEHERTGELIQKLASFEAPISSFTLELRNFSAFAPKVIFVDVIPNQQLVQLQRSLHDYLRATLNLVSDRPERPFHPHMTVAFKDLRKAVFPKAWAYFKGLEYQRSFVVNSIYLLKHNGKVWELEKEIPLS